MFGTCFEDSWIMFIILFLNLYPLHDSLLSVLHNYTATNIPIFNKTFLLPLYDFFLSAEIIIWSFHEKCVYAWNIHFELVAVSSMSYVEGNYIYESQYSVEGFDWFSNLMCVVVFVEETNVLQAATSIYELTRNKNQPSDFTVLRLKMAKTWGWHIGTEMSFNSLGPSDAIWRWRSWSTLVQVMACCLMAPSHYRNQRWLIISKVLWHSSEDIIIRRFEDTNK